jgi:hypothetical protein
VTENSEKKCYTVFLTIEILTTSPPDVIGVNNQNSVAGLDKFDKFKKYYPSLKNQKK